MDPYSKTIPCPEHPNGRAHWWSLRRHRAILFCQGSRWAGIWECPITGSSDTHEHSDYDIETTENWPTSPTDIPQEYEIYVCGGPDGCGVVIEGEDPAADRYDAMVDMQIMEALGK